MYAVFKYLEIEDTVTIFMFFKIMYIVLYMYFNTKDKNRRYRHSYAT
jgi:hypothetical protein